MNWIYAYLGGVVVAKFILSSVVHDGPVLRRWIVALAWPILIFAVILL